jgi:DNA-binding LytR/AlgR family response regulator
MKVLIIEDETAAAVNLQAILRRVAPDAEVLTVLESIAESIEWMTTHPQPDLILMDIHLADGESFRIFERTSVTAPVIFTTAYDRYALEAFKVNSIDYLLKPIQEEEVRRALEKLRRLSQLERSHYTERVGQVMAHAGEQQRMFLIRVRDKFVPLAYEQIAYCYTNNERVTATTMTGISYPLDKPLDTLQEVLPTADFFRANRQFIISRQAIVEIVVWFGNRLSLRLQVATPEQIIISKARVPEFKRWLTAVQPDR